MSKQLYLDREVAIFDRLKLEDTKSKMALTALVTAAPLVSFKIKYIFSLHARHMALLSQPFSSHNSVEPLTTNLQKIMSPNDNHTIPGVASYLFQANYIKKALAR